jgi:hypothetical protein
MSSPWVETMRNVGDEAEMIITQAIGSTVDDLEGGGVTPSHHRTYGFEYTWSQEENSGSGNAARAAAHP